MAKYYIRYRIVNGENRIISNTTKKPINLPQDENYFHFDEEICGDITEAGIPFPHIGSEYGPSHYDFLEEIGWLNLRKSYYSMEADSLYNAYKAQYDYDNVQSLEGYAPYETWVNSQLECRSKYPKPEGE